MDSHLDVIQDGHAGEKVHTLKGPDQAQPHPLCHGQAGYIHLAEGDLPGSRPVCAGDEVYESSLPSPVRAYEGGDPHLLEGGVEPAYGHQATEVPAQPRSLENGHTSPLHLQGELCLQSPGPPLWSLTE